MAIQEAKEQIGKLFDTGYKTLTKKKFFIDSSDDLTNLPDENECLTGSKAIDTSTGDVYMMNTEGEWNKVFDSEDAEGGSSEGGNNSESGFYLVHLHFDMEDPTKSYIEESFSEVLSIFKSGKIPCIWIGYETEDANAGVGETLICFLGGLTSGPISPDNSYVYYVNFLAPAFFTATAQDPFVTFKATTPDESMTIEINSDNDTSGS